jgi:hypothetical protein
MSETVIISEQTLKRILLYSLIRGEVAVAPAAERSGECRLVLELFAGEHSAVSSPPDAPTGIGSIHE